MTIKIVNYDPKWPINYDVERNRLTELLHNINIEHIGSTSIIGLAAKPIIDILVGTEAVALNTTLQILTYNGYVLEGRRNGGSHSWLSSPSPENRQYIIHLVIFAGDEWRRRLKFRDYMRSNPSAAAEYEHLKRQSAQLHSTDLDAYTAAKAEYVHSITVL